MNTAIVPAAGRSARMGRPKLLLPIHGQTLIAHVVTALREGGAERVVVVAPPADSEEGPAVARAAEGAGALVIAPDERPAEMRDSIEIGLAAAARPEPPERVLLSPGDAAGITPGDVAALLEASCRGPGKIVVPRSGERRGHPLVLPWKLATEIGSLPAGEGVNALLARHQAIVVEVRLGDSHSADDIDSPEDFRRWQERHGKPADGGAASMRLRVRLFALARERAGCSEIDLELTGEPRVREVKAEIARRLPELAPLLKTAMIAVNEEYADDEAAVTAGARIAIIPPVSGGGEAGMEAAALMIEITASPIDHAAVTERVRATNAGAVCTFLGTVRDLTGDRKTVALQYEAYGEMALKKLTELECEARSRWPIVELAPVHRTGDLGPGEVSVVVAVSTPHRHQAFEACRWLIDTLKEVVPIWKRETWDDGKEEWVHPGMDAPGGAKKD